MFCLTVAEKNYDKIFEKIKKGSQYTDFFELRIDYLEKPEFSKVREILKLPYKFLFTFRSKKEGGAKRVSEKTQLEWILWALEEKFHLVDIEWQLLKKYYKKLNITPYYYNKILVSYHNFHKTPSDKYLNNLLKEMYKKGVKRAKIVCICQVFQDSLRLLNLVSRAKEFGIELISFGMETQGKLSRILCLLAGSPFTYVVLTKEEAVAPGQLDIVTAKNTYFFLKNFLNS